MTAKHAHEMEARGETRWTAKMAKDGLLRVTDEASGEEFVCTAYTLEGQIVRFSLPGDNGLRRLDPGAPGHEAFYKVVEKALNGPSEPEAAPAAAKSTVKS